MLRYSVLWAVLLTAAGSAHASWADNLFDEHVKDFGSVPHGTVAVHPFRLVNNTSAALRISNVRVYCGCTAARAVQTYLAPGQETAILAQMDTRRFYNTKTVTIFVQFDQPRFEEVRLAVTANSRDDLSLSPDTINFGKVKRGTPASAETTVTFQGGSTQITEATSDSNYLTPEFKQIRRDNGEIVYQVTARMRPDAPAGKWYSDVWLTTNNPAMPRVRVPLAMEIESPLSISPATVVLGQIKAGEESDRKVVLRGAKPFRIMSILGTDDQVRVRETNTEAKTVHVLTVTLHPTAAGPLSRVLHVRTDLPTGGDIDLNAQADVVEDE
jgi:hypothetical protein